MTRINLRLITHIANLRLTYFAMLSFTQTLEGVGSLQPNGKHIIMWDFDASTLNQVEETLRNVQQKYNLSHIYIVSDIEGSYRAWCFTQVELKTLLHILLDTDHIDKGFFYYTARRQKATLRTSNKKGRPDQHIERVLESYPEHIPDRMERVVYDTGLDKQGYTLLLGEKDG